MTVLLTKPLKILLALTILFIGGYIAYVLVILLWQPPSNLSKTRYDGIIVLTGAHGRIETGFELLLDNTAPKLLISGVQKQIDFNTLVKANSESLSPDQIRTIQNHCCISLDYIANTTQTNAIESTKWIKNNNLNKIIIVTSAQHMPRAYLQFHAHIDNHVTLASYPYFQTSRLALIKRQDFWKATMEEYLKFYGSLIQITKE